MENLRLYEIHRKSFANYEAIKQSKQCGCFYCKKIFGPSEVVEFVTENNGEMTAICPYCGIDSVIQDVDIEITTEILDEMNTYWF